MFTAIALAEGLAWCLGTIWLIADGDQLQVLTLLLTWSGVVAGALVVFGSYARTYLVFTYPAMIPHIWLFWHHPYPYGNTILTLLIIYMASFPIIVSLFNAQLREGLRFRFENLDLAEDMRIQKERADQANAAKSSFLAAASHDLRQPIHALGLFIGALRGRKMDKESRQIVDHIDRSVGAMDDLFASMLDISKLDAGVVQARLETVAIAPLLERLCRDHSGEAADKGITLRLVTSSAWVISDPVLLERIIRNLVANAVRYTGSGGVLVGCRRRAGALSIEIWDTGSGISTADQSRIFDEFYQVGNPERDRTKGLGLGLAIVKRIAPLIGATLTLESASGRGSAFRLSVPLCTGELPIIPLAETEPKRAGRTGSIFVIDDEVEIRQAMAVLLTSWGHSVTVGGSAGEVMMSAAATGIRPDLIVSDYRLRDGDTGIAAIQAVQETYGSTVPAMLITGDTAPDRIIEATAGGFLLLHKPLSNAKLRAAVGNMLLRTGSA